jgi:AraC-like DNA-binding protein
VHLRRVFSSVFGISPAKYVINERIILAKDLIKLPYMNIEDVAEQCGFSTLTYFFKTFKKITGETPSAYRKSNI